MKKLIKILPIIMTILMVIMTVSSVFASDFTPANVSPETGNTTGIQNIGNNILGIIRVVGTVIAVGVLMVLGIKYMMGSAEEKAEYKKTMLPYLIGAVLLFAAVNLAGWIYDTASGIGDTTTS